MRKTKTILAGFALVLFLGPTILAGQKQKDEKEEIDLLIKSVKFLEERPLDKKAKDVRSWGVKWIIATDRVSVNICSLVLSGKNTNTTANCWLNTPSAWLHSSSVIQT